MSDDMQQGQTDAKPNSRTFIEDGTEFKGQLTSACHIVVCGSIEGEIKAPKLTITESGTVVGQVRAERIYSEGVLAGTIDADELYLSGQVRSDTVIRAKSMEVKLSQEGRRYEVTFGTCTLAVGDDPRAEAQPENEMAKAEPSPEAPELVAQASEQEQKPPEESAEAAPASSAEPAGEAAPNAPKGKGKQKRSGAEMAQGEAPAQSGGEESTAMASPSSPPPAH